MVRESTILYLMVSRTAKTFEQLWRSLPEHVQLTLSTSGLNSCCFWARLVDGEEYPEEVIIDTVHGLCGDLQTEDGDPDEE